MTLKNDILYSPFIVWVLSRRTISRRGMLNSDCSALLLNCNNWSKVTNHAMSFVVFMNEEFSARGHCI